VTHEFRSIATVSRRHIVLVVLAAGAVTSGAWLLARGPSDSQITITVRRGPLTAALTTTGVLKPSRSTSYHSPLVGRDVEVTFLAPEGTRVNEGDLLARVDATEFQRDLDRARQELRQAEIELQVAEIDRQTAQAAVESLSEGEGALTVDEARTRVQLAQKKVGRLRAEHESLRPLLAKGYITREELNRAADELQQAEEELAMLQRRADILVQQTHPRDRQRAELQRAQKDAQRENARAHVVEAMNRVKLLSDQIADASIYARNAGLVVYDEYVNASPRRKIRVGDRVTATQGLVTTPEVDRVIVEASVGEADLRRVRAGQLVRIALEAFPDAPLTGRVRRVGTLARAPQDRPGDAKRFDLIVDVDPAAVDLRPEMTARVDIITTERADALLVPINAVFEQGGRAVAFVRGRFAAEARPIELGESDGTLVEIISGLREGDRVLLTGPGGDARPADVNPAGAMAAPLGQNSGRSRAVESR